MASSNNKRVDYDLNYVDFSHNERKKIIDWIAQRKYTIEDCLVALQEQNVKVSISLDQNNGSTQISVTPRDKKLPAFGNVYIYKHVELKKSLQLALYHFREVLDNGNKFTAIDNDLDW